VDTIRICEVLRAMEAYSCYAQFLVSNSVSIQTFVTTSAHTLLLIWWHWWFCCM